MNKKNKTKLIIAASVVAVCAAFAYKSAPQYCTVISLANGFQSEIYQSGVIRDYGVFFSFQESINRNKVLYSGYLKSMPDYKENKNIRVNLGETSFVKAEQDGRVVYSVKDQHRTYYVDSRMCN